jgi:quinol monooxygenase YgiN
LRFDVWEDKEEPNTVFLYEAYTDEAAFETHQTMEPFKHFVDHIVPNVIEAPIFILPPGHAALTNLGDVLPGAN